MQRGQPGKQAVGNKGCEPAAGASSGVCTGSPSVMSISICNNLSQKPLEENNEFSANETNRELGR